ncbi:nucleotidyl transferase AbiEii/AbiGii toxin family protein [Rhizobium leguminosarum]|uniref:nucleotidyl transferase AbiEii/AbiGii toxin family protein n=1 Tax=Rhizobium leguminosarum TaxID=384 RepID=UPI0014420B2E|nr:nucleotidyl transferase AbiEii/AbiGii toxin family protein [Rhizobium leguminosarum]MBY3026506.1 nucleotidyl transferase AbiEii/AbiGii toxin family protein [Rhizobium leguminosarum]NKL74114.1 hypothetical protein [Rhizobium leguminosarum bv. viciae]
MSKDTTLIDIEGKKLKQKIEAACYAVNPATRERVRIMDTQTALARATGEEVLRGILAGIKTEPLIKGGYAYPQQLRETADIDLLFMREVAPWEIVRSFDKIRADMAAKGMRLVDYAEKPKEMTVNGQVVHRYEFKVAVGPSEIKNHVDISWGGKYKFPKHRAPKRHGNTFYAVQKPVLGHFQSMESQAADKLVAILNPKTTRWKDFSDLALLKSMNLDQQVIASEVVWKLSTTFGDPDLVMAALKEEPETLKYEYIKAKAETFEKWLAKSGPARARIDFIATMQPVRQFYASIRQIIGAARVRKVHGVNPTVQEVKAAFRKAQAEKDTDKQVVTLSDYRLKTGSDLVAQLKR